MDTRPVAMYDANVLYPAQLRDLLMRLAVSGLVRAHWSNDIHDEWMRNVHANYEDVTWDALQRTKHLMDTALPGASVEGYETHIETLSLPDSDDRHVLAAAIHIGADYIVTFNLNDFPASQLDPYGVEAIAPDDFISLLMDRDMKGVIDTAAQHRQSLRKPPMDISAYLECLRNAGLERATRRIQEYRDQL